MRSLILACLIGVVCVGTAMGQVEELEEILDRPVRAFTGDLDEIRERRIIRVLTTYNQSNFFLAGGRIHGFEYELLAKYEEHLNKNVSRRSIRTDMVFVPVQKEQLLPLLEVAVPALEVLLPQYDAFCPDNLLQCHINLRIRRPCIPLTALNHSSNSTILPLSFTCSDLLNRRLR